MSQAGEGTEGTQASTLGKRPVDELAPEEVAEWDIDRSSGADHAETTAGIERPVTATSTAASSEARPSQTYVQVPDHVRQQQFQLQQQQQQQQHQLQHELLQQHYQLQQQQQQHLHSVHRAAAAFAHHQQQGAGAGAAQNRHQQPGRDALSGQHGRPGQTPAATVGVPSTSGLSARVPSPSQKGGGSPGQVLSSLPGISGDGRSKAPVSIAPAGTTAVATGAYGGGRASPVYVAGGPPLQAGALGAGAYAPALAAYAGATVPGLRSAVPSHTRGAGVPGVGAPASYLLAGVGAGAGGAGPIAPFSQPGGGTCVPGVELTTSALGEGGAGVTGVGAQPPLAIGTAATTMGGADIGGGEALLRVTGKINLVYKLMVLKRLYAKMKASRELGYDGGAFTWKTTEDEYRKHQKPMFEEVLESWEDLPEASRQKYGCTNYKSTPFPTVSTAKSFFTDASKSYHKYKNQPKSTMQGTFWKDAGPTMAAMLALLQASSNDGDGGEARDDATGRAQRQNAERLSTRKAQQEAAGSVSEMFVSLQEQAETLGNRNQEDVQRADEHLAVARETKEMLATSAKESAEREKERDRLTGEFRNQQIAAQNDRARKQEVQHEQLLDVFSDEIRVSAGGVTIPWHSYEEFWADLPLFGVPEQELVEAKLTMDELMDMAREKDFASDLTSIGIKKIDALKIANLIKRKVYGKK